jgi:Ferredoxin-like domain in Api92-like protein
MPNWTNNSVIVSAKTEAELHEFIDFCDKPHTSHWKDFNSKEVLVDENTKGVFWNFLSPLDTEAYFDNEPRTPNPDLDIMADIANQFATGMDWYNWNVRNWGTKWDIQIHPEELTFDQNNDGDYYFHWYFDTAWSPAEQAYRAMARRFPNLSFNYEITEEANFFAGILVFENGELVSEEWVDSPTHADFEALDIPCAQCNWTESGNCLDIEDESTLELELSTTTQSGE